MKQAMETSDVIIGIMAALGVVVLLVVFVMVVKKIFLSKDTDTE
jgi:hypothetical protein